MDSKIEELTKHVQKLELKNKELEKRVKQLEQPSPVRSAVTRQTLQRSFEVGDRIRILRPACPGTNRQVTPADSLATITRVRLPWVHAWTDSGLNM